jgi:hypothetical protein
MIMAHRRDFGQKLSIRRVIQQIGSIFIDFLRRLHTSSLLGGSLISPTFGSLVVSVSYTRRKDLVNLEVDVMRVSFLAMHQTPKHIEYSIKPPGKLKKHVMQSLMNLMAPKGKLLVMIM